MNTSRYCAALLLIITACLTGCNKETTDIGGLEIRSAINQSSPNWKTEYISILANPAFTKDRDFCTLEIIRRIRENDFDTYDFSYDEAGYPNMLSVTVYANSEKESEKVEPIFVFDYVTDFNYDDPEDQNNIFEDLEMFRVEYHKS